MGESTVEPALLDEFGDRLAELAAQARDARDYLRHHIDMSGANGILRHSVVDGLASARDSLDDAYDHLEGLARGSAAQLARTAHEYRTAEDRSAVDLDSVQVRGGEG